jgi:HEAT repeat protein
MFGSSKYTRIIRRLKKEMLKENENGIRSALEALENLRTPQFTEPLVELLSNRENWGRARAAAAMALGRMEQPGSLEALIVALGDREWLVRAAAAEALGHTGASAMEPLLKALGDQESSVRRAAVSALGKIGDPGAVQTLIWVLDDAARDVRVAAALSLSRIGDLRAVEPLTDMLSDQNGDVRAAAAKALDGLGEPQWKELVCGTEEDIARLGKSKDPRAERQFLRMLDKWFEPRNAYSLDALSIDETNARISAAYALGDLGDPRAVDTLARILTVGFENEYLQKAARWLWERSRIRAP